MQRYRLQTHRGPRTKRSPQKQTERSPDDRSDVDLRRSDAAGEVAVGIAGKVYALFGSQKKMPGGSSFPLAASPLADSSVRMLGGSSLFAVRKVACELIVPCPDSGDRDVLGSAFDLGLTKGV